MDPSGPVVVAIGGGHGLSATLRAVRRYASKVTGIVSVADDGGSSGRLRERIPDLPAPGDVRKCLGALAADDEPFARILEHRLGEGDLEGHAVGNLLLTALTFELGSFQAAVDEVGNRVGAVGRVLPATQVAVELVGTTASGGRVAGQVAVHETPGIERLELRPAEASSSPEVAEAILEADQVLVGPGSLVTSVLAAAIVPAVRDALAQTSAQRIHLANLAPQDPETLGMGPAEETDLLLGHGVALDAVLLSPERAEQHPPPAPRAEGPAWLVRPVCRPAARVHDPVLLADALRWAASQRVG
ncbi:MAG: uridine diphosphate-N-acetylglucosamine-binding protein YvcK [Acidimicrobiales bacterium]